MKKFIVKLGCFVVERIEVKAEDEHEALNIAKKLNPKWMVMECINSKSNANAKNASK